MTGAAKFGDDVAPRLVAVERTVTHLEKDVGEVKVTLAELNMGQNKLNEILLRMEAASDAREEDQKANPKPSWRSQATAAGAILGMVLVFGQIESWFFSAQLANAMAPVNVSITENAHRTASTIAENEHDRIVSDVVAEIRLARLESAVQWTPGFRKVAADVPARPQTRRNPKS